MIFKTVELFQLDKEVLQAYQERFRYIMVDEYQDTNTAQFELIRLLAMKYKNFKEEWFIFGNELPLGDDAIRRRKNNRVAS